MEVVGSKPTRSTKNYAVGVLLISRVRHREDKKLGSSSQRIQTNEFLEFVGSFCSKLKTFVYAALVQLVERLLAMEKVVGSSPTCRSKICVYVVVVANDLAMVEAPVRARIDALKFGSVTQRKSTCLLSRES